MSRARKMIRDAMRAGKTIHTLTLIYTVEPDGKGHVDIECGGLAPEHVMMMLRGAANDIESKLRAAEPVFNAEPMVAPVVVEEMPAMPVVDEFIKLSGEMKALADEHESPYERPSREATLDVASEVKAVPS